MKWSVSNAGFCDLKGVTTAQSRAAPSIPEESRIKATSDIIELSGRAQREDVNSDGFKIPPPSFRTNKDEGGEVESKRQTITSHPAKEPEHTTPITSSKPAVEVVKRKRGRPPKPKRGRPPKAKTVAIEAASRVQALINGDEEEEEEDLEDSEDGLSNTKPPPKKKPAELEITNGSDPRPFSSKPTTSSGHSAATARYSAHTIVDDADGLVDQILAASRPEASSRPNSNPMSSTQPRNLNKYIDASSSSSEDEAEPYDAMQAIAEAKAKKAAVTANGHTSANEVEALLRRENEELRDLYEVAIRESEEVVEEWKQHCQKTVDKGRYYKDMAKALYQRSEEDKAEIERLEKELAAAAANAQWQQEREALLGQISTLHAEVASLHENLLSGEATHLKKLTKLEKQHKKDQEAISKLTELSIMFEERLESKGAETPAVDSRVLKSLEMEAEELRKENEELTEETKRLRRERERAVRAAEDHISDTKELQAELLTTKNRLHDVEARQETLQLINNSASTRAPDWTPSLALGPLESFLSVAVDPTNPKQWHLQCRNPKTHTELHFSIEVLDDSLEYVPMDFKENNLAGNPSELPDYLKRPIYFEHAALAPFLSKMLSFLYRAKN